MFDKGRVASAGDARYCASPAAGKGALLSVIGASALADFLLQHNCNFQLAFEDYNNNLRSFIEEVQAKAESNVRGIFLEPVKLFSKEILQDSVFDF